MRWLPGLAVGTGLLAAGTADRVTEPDGIERASADRALAANGVGKIADRLYFSGGYNEASPAASRIGSGPTTMPTTS